MNPRARWWLFGGVLALALLVRVAVVLATPGYQPRTDAADFDRRGASLAQGHGFGESGIVPGPSAFRPPATPVALAAVYLLTGDREPDRWVAARLFLAAVGTLGVALLGLLALQAWGWPEALVAGALAAVYPPLVAFGSSILSEPVFVALELAALLAALRCRRGARVRWAVLAGVLCGMAALTRSNGVVLALPLLLLCVRRPGRGPQLAAGVALVAVMALTVAPWTLRNARVMGDLVPISTQGGYALAGTYNDLSMNDRANPAIWQPAGRVPALRFAFRAPGEAQWSRQLSASARDYIVRHPLSPLLAAGWNSVRALDLQGAEPEVFVQRFVAVPSPLVRLGVYGFWAAAVLALAALPLRVHRRLPWEAWAVPLVLLASAIFISGNMRYRLPADPFVLLLDAAAICAAVRRGKRSAIHHPFVG